MANLVFDFLHNYKTGERRESDPADAYQYDEGHVFEAVVPVAVTSCEIHYWARGFDEAEAYTPASITQNTDNSYTITGNIPNKFFETYGDLRVYIVVTDGDASITTYEGRIHICERSKPDDYVDDDPDNEATRVLVEAQEAAATATQKAADAATSAGQAAESARTLTLDTTLTQSGQAADAKAAGDAINDLKEELGDLSDLETEDKSSIVAAINEATQSGGSGSGLTEDVKQAMLQIAQKVAYVDAQGQTYYDALYDALYPPADLVRISAVYTQSGTVTNWDTLDALKSDLVVTAHLSNGATQTVSNYFLTGSLEAPSSTITVTYGGKSATFTVAVTHSDLPAGYTQYDYIEMTGVPTNGTAARYYVIPTDAQMHSDYTLETEIGFGANRDSSNLSFDPFFGARNGASGQFDFAFYARSANGQIKFIFNGNEMTLTSPTLPTTANHLNKIKYLPVGASESHPDNNVLAVNGAEYNTNLAVSDTEFRPWFGFFGYATAASGYPTSTLYYRGYVIGITEIKDQNGNLVYKFIPAKNSDDIYGFFETVHSRFYYNNYNDGALLSHYTGGNLEG